MKPLTKATSAACDGFVVDRRRQRQLRRPPASRRRRPLRRGPSGAFGSSSASFESTRAWKTAPSPATPVAIPTWRKVVLIPEPIPDFSTGTTAIAAWPIPGLVDADPDPGEDEAGQQRRPARVRRDAVHQQQADPDHGQPDAEQDPDRDPVRERAGDRGDDEAEHGQRQEAQPASSGEKSSTPCM